MTSQCQINISLLLCTPSFHYPSSLSPAPPSAPTNLSVSAITTTSFLLTWTNPFNGNSPLTTATIALNSSGELTSFQADTLTSHQFQGLVPNQQYQIEVVIRNTIGPSLPGSVATLTLPLGKCPPPPHTCTQMHTMQHTDRPSASI